jgi:CheY-like chemotaxis protein
MKKKKIWIVDDDAIYQIIIDKLIKKSEMFSDKSSFKNGQEAINALYNSLNNEELLPDIILLDVNMPIMDGWEFMEEMKGINSKINKKITIYIVSSSIAPEDKTKSKTFEIFDYISKPISVEDIMSIAEKQKNTF